MPPKTLVLHIGDHKTGSTTIQYAFAGKRANLAGRQIRYPGTLSHNSLRAQVDALSQRGPARKQAEAWLKRTADSFAASPADTLLLSAETLDGADPQRVKSMIDRFFAPVIDELRIAAYVRPHAPRVLSSFATQIKSGRFSSTLEDFHRLTFKQERLLYLPRFNRWRETFGSAFRLRPMIRDRLVQKSVLDDFITHMLDSTDYRLKPLPAANSSLPLRDLMRLKLFQSCQGHLTQKERHTLGWEFMRLAGLQPDPTPQPKLALHRALAEEIRDTYAADASAMDLAFFDGVATLRPELDLAVDKAIPKAQSVAPEDYFDAAEIRSLTALANLAAAILQNSPSNWQTTLKKKRVDALAL
ncbi:hypothetical protein [Tritonibacter horizontis]|uniref:Uncharacterized protein n=1 Tax=Tritonibacter horizontis TaxID=1768241 RepID=A0A132BZ32_9RHOB|nr:hypothetical protein [Tritonibacter horizontis]KUP93554.1 hypothetical protein TRIHO_15770 [Tritonibacter horizontis]